MNSEEEVLQNSSPKIKNLSTIDQKLTFSFVFKKKNRRENRREDRRENSLYDSLYDPVSAPHTPLNNDETS